MVIFFACVLSELFEHYARISMKYWLGVVQKQQDFDSNLQDSFVDYG